MSARYKDLSVEVRPQARSMHIRCRIENLGPQPWRQADGFAIGWQIYDPATDLFISEGRWAPLDRDLAPGQEGELRVEVSLPAERGPYRIYVSPIEPETGWHYSRGWPFLVIDAAVEDRQARLVRARTSTETALHWEKNFQLLGKALSLPVLSIWNNRSLLRSLVRRDILGRYRGSFGDVLWAVLNPLLLMLTYFFVFGIVLQARFGDDPSRAGFALYFLAGMLPWLAFSEPAARAPGVIVEHRNFVKRLVFPVEILPVTQVASGLVTQAFALAVFLLFLLATRGGVPASVLWLPVLLIPQVLFTMGVSWLLAATGAFVRDLGQMIGFVLTLWFFLTPICYPEALLPAWAEPLLRKNPMFVLVRGFRAVFLEGQAPAWGPLWKLWVLAAAVWVLGHAFFYKLRKSFPDVV